MSGELTFSLPFQDFPPHPVAENNINDEVRPVGKPQDAPVPSILNPDKIVNGSNDPLKGIGDGSSVSNTPPPVPENNINDEVPSIPNPEDIAKLKANGPVPSIPNPEDIVKPKANGDGSGVNNPPPVVDIKGDTSPDLVNNEAPKSDENVSP